MDRAGREAPRHEGHHERRTRETQRIEAEGDGDRKAEQESPDRRPHEVVHRQFGRPEPTPGALEITQVDRRRDHRHAGRIDHRFGRCQEGSHQEEHPDRHLIEQDDGDEAGHHHRTRHVETHPQHTTVVAVGPRAARKNEDQPRQALGHRHTGDQTRVVGHRCGEQRQRHEAETVSEVRQCRGTPQQPEVAWKRGTEPSAPTVRIAQDLRRIGFSDADEGRPLELAGVHAQRLEC